tara:strand:+ start:4006 stop:4398 length:393 start_codon:yes stop_codon:yes gene_type:complete
MKKYTISRNATTVRTIEVFADSLDEAIMDARATDPFEWSDDAEVGAEYKSESSKPLTYRIFDNMGRTQDRYTLVLPQVNEHITMSADAGDVNGVFLRGDGLEQLQNVGRAISIDDVPAKVRDIVMKEVGL